MRLPVVRWGVCRLVVAGSGAVYVCLVLSALLSVHRHPPGTKAPRTSQDDSYPPIGIAKLYPGRFLLHSARPSLVEGQPEAKHHPSPAPLDGGTTRTIHRNGTKRAIVIKHPSRRLANGTRILAVRGAAESVAGGAQVLAMLATALSAHDKRLLLDTAKNFASICQRLNISYFLYGGTLLGSYRHHDIIPWDDDLDLLVDVESKDEVFSALRMLSPQYDIYMAGPRLKMWSIHATKTSKYPWYWPYLDISFYAQNDTHIWDTAPEFSQIVYPKSIVFPLHKRPLEDYFFWAPRDSYANLKLAYTSITECSTPYYSHKRERHIKSTQWITLPCQRLSDSVPFVHRTPHQQGGVVETLQLGGATLHSIVVEEPRDVTSDPQRNKT